MRYRCNIRYLIMFLVIAISFIFYKTLTIERHIFAIDNDLKFGSHIFDDKSQQSSYNLKELYLKKLLLRDINIGSFDGELIVHLDLKGAPPSINYLKQLFPILHALNVTSLLMEYEDMFPYSAKFTHASNTYSKRDVQLLLNSAKRNNLHVIPLVQTFGHLEFLLKIRKFLYLREVNRYPQSICPSHNDTFDIITGMLDEVIALHPQLRYIHIGCDEVYQLGVCSYCNIKMFQNRWSVKDLFLFHVTRIAKYIRTTYPHITPLIWDDELRSISIDKLRKFKIGTLVEPVVWWYQPKISLPASIWDKYSKIFPAVWVASSFKGATGPDQILPNISYHLENQVSWIQLMANYSHSIVFRGIIVTGWQRYDHFAVLCELLPVSIPSLVNSLLLLKGRSSFVDNSKQIKDIIACGKKYEFLQMCKFPGINLYYAVIEFTRLKNEVDKVLESSNINGWLTAHNFRHGYFNPLLFDELSYKIGDCQNRLIHSRNMLKIELGKIYDSYTVTEWIETYVKAYVLKFERISNIFHHTNNITEWPLRPIGTFDNKNA